MPVFGKMSAIIADWPFCIAGMVTYICALIFVYDTGKKGKTCICIT